MTNKLSRVATAWPALVKARACCIFIGLPLLAPSLPSLSAQAGDQLLPLPPNSIRLSGHLENSIQKSLENWNKGVVPYSKFVDFFRHGRKKFALGEMWGKAVRSGCMFYRYSQDQELKRILDATVRDMLATQHPNGSISCTPPEQQPGGPDGDLWERKYVLLGLLEYYEWVNSDPLVLESLVKQADCIIAQVGRAPKKEITDLGWSATNIGYEPCHIESSTLLEPFMRLHKLTGHRRFLDFATYIVESGGTKHYNVFEQAYNNVEPHKMAGHYPKAYEMLSLFEGLVEYYRATGDPKWKQSALNLYKNVRASEITIIGNGGGNHPYHPRVAGEAWDNTAIEQTNPDITRMMETCTGVTWLKFCSQILRLTGDSHPMDEIEKYIYNGLLGAMKPDGGGFSYVNLFNGQKVNGRGWGWKFDDLHVTCCNLNGPMGLAYIPWVAVMSSASGPVVNLYNAATVTMTTPAREPLQLNIETDFPQSGNVVIRMNPKIKETFTLRLRIPGWSENTVVAINGEKQTVAPGHYAAFNREWKAGDRVEIAFDMACRLVDAPRGSNPKGHDFQAVTWGPIVLARDEKTDAGYDQPVTIKAGKGGLVNVVKTKPSLATTCLEFLVPTTDGDIHMVDYASVDAWDGSKICTWLPTKPRRRPAAPGDLSARQPRKEDILNALRLANDYFMTKWSDPGKPVPYPSRNLEYPSNIWTRAYYYEGLACLWKIDPQQRYLDYALEWGNKHDWKLCGTKNGWGTRNADNQCAGQTYLFLHETDPSKPAHYISNIKKSVDAMLASDKIDDWHWIDALQMAMPVFAMLGNITGDAAYHNRAHDMYMFAKHKHGGNGLYNPADALWWRDRDFTPPRKEPNGKNCYWSRGNGWVLVAMARMLDILPKDSPHRKEYETMLVDMCHALKKVQREDGFWNVSLHDPSHYGGKELTGTAMFAHGMAFGVNAGLLDAGEFAPVIYKAWNAMVSDCLHATGFLGYVQGTGKEPKDAQPVTHDREPDFEDFGLGAFLMAGAEIYKIKTPAQPAQKISFDHFNVERLDATRARVTAAASGDNFKSFCFHLERLTPGATTPPGFYTNRQGFTYLNASAEKGKNTNNFTLDHPANESKKPGEFAYTFDSTNWAPGRYLVIVQAHNRPGPGGYEVERKVFYIDAGPPIPPIVSNIPSAKHQLIYSQNGVYAAFPALWLMDGGRLGLSFSTKTTDRHVDSTGGSKTMLSTDEGRTWVDTNEPLYLSASRRADGSLVRALAQGWLQADISEEPRLTAEHRHPHRSSDTRVAWLGGLQMQVSKDNGRSWDTTLLPMPENLSGANNYHYYSAHILTSGGIRLGAVYGKKHFPGAPEKLGPYEVFIMRSTDDGHTWETRPMFPGGLPDPAIGFDETALVETSGGKILALSRSSLEDGLWQSESPDGGLTWTAPVKTPMKGFPAHVIRLKDGRLLCAYGMRRQAPQGIRAVLSDDDGKTWDIKNELIIRGDGAGNPSDMGYPLLYQRADGSILVVYYLTTDGAYPSIWATTFNLDDKKHYNDTHLIHGKAEPLDYLKTTGPFVRLLDGSLFAPTWGGACLVSNDEGRTWNEYPTVDSARFSTGSPVAVQTRKGTIIVGFYNVREKSPLNWDKTTHSHDPGASLPAYVISSRDNGKTWSPPVKLHSEWTGANRRMLETKDGHVVFSTQTMRNNPGRNCIITYVSSDDGATWTPGTLLDSPSSAGDHDGLMEADILQLNDGRLWMLIRTNRDYFYESFSTDNGLTWSACAKTAIDASSAPGALLRLQSGRILLAWNRLFHKGRDDTKRVGGDKNFTAVPASYQRDELSLMWSDDDGKTWSAPVIIAENKIHTGDPLRPRPDFLAYPHLFEQAKGAIWLTADYGKIKIAIRERDLP